jgi:hypothetical protein
MKWKADIISKLDVMYTIQSEVEGIREIPNK